MRIRTSLLLLGISLGWALACGGLGGKDGDEDEDEDGDSGGGDSGGGDTDEPDPGCVADGFSPTTTSWALPGGYAEATFDTLADTRSADPDWALTDLDGDGLSDLVVTADSVADPDLGTSSWLLYRNTGAGFSATPTTWSLPAGYREGTFPSIADTSSSTPAWGLLDLDGDGAPDLVIAADDANDDLGTTAWWVYLNTGDGFDPVGASWALPGGYAAGTFDAIADDSTSSPSWTLLDLDGDDRYELVVTRDDATGGGLGTTEWLVYDNSGSRFAPTATSWTLPGGYPDDTFTLAYDAQSSDPAWALVDLDGDGAPQLVVTEDAADPALGVTEWATPTRATASAPRPRAGRCRWATPPGCSTAHTTRARPRRAGPSWTRPATARRTSS